MTCHYMINDVIFLPKCHQMLWKVTKCHQMSDWAWWSFQVIWNISNSVNFLLEMFQITWKLHSGMTKPKDVPPFCTFFNSIPSRNCSCCWNSLTDFQYPSWKECNIGAPVRGSFSRMLNTMCNWQEFSSDIMDGWGGLCRMIFQNLNDYIPRVVNMFFFLLFLDTSRSDWIF